jgi:hypothetical protein
MRLPSVGLVDRLLGWNRTAGVGLRATVVVLTIVSAAGALIVDRFAGPGGPWLWNFDMTLANYPFASYLHEALSHGQLPLWNDRIGLGFPLYAEGQIGALYPPNWLIFQLPPLQALDVSRVLHLILAGVGAGLIVLRMSGSRSGAIAAAVVAVMSGGIVSKLEWTQVVTVYGWLPWVILPLVWRRSGPTRGLIALAGVAWGIQALGGHPPYWVLTGITAVTVLIAQRPRLGTIQRIIGFGLVGFGVGAVQLIPTLLLTTLSTRATGVGSDALFEFSATPFDFLGVAFANAFVPATGSPWNLFQSWYPGGSVWSTLEVYAFVGLPGLAFAAIGLRTKRARPILAVAVVAILIPLLGVLKPGIWAAIPGLDGLRHPIRAYLILDFALAIGAGLGVARMARTRSVKPAVAILGIAIGGYVVVAALAALAPGAFDFIVPIIWPYVPAGQEDTIRTLVTGTMIRLWPIALELVFAAAAILLLLARQRAALTRLIAVALIGLPLALFVPAVNSSQPESTFSLAGTPVIAMLQHLAPSQILTINEPFYPGFPDQLSGVGSREPHVYTSQFGLSLRLQAGEDLIAELRNAGAGSPLAKAVGVDTVVVFGSVCGPNEILFDPSLGAHICRLDGQLRPPYWMPGSAIVTSTTTGSLPTAPIEAIVDPSRAISGAKAATVTSWTNGSASIEVSAPAAGYVFIDRSWWPGWQVTVDGQGVVPEESWSGQLVAVPAGSHVIEERFVPWDLFLGAFVSLITLLGLLAWSRPWKRRPEQTRLPV